MKLHKVVLIIFYDSRKRILLQDRRGISKAGEEWGYFGGHIEKGETPKQTLMRETKEELSYNLKTGEYRHLGHFVDTFNNMTIDRQVYIAPMPLLSKLKLTEGKKMKLFTLKQALGLKMVSGGDKGVVRALAKTL